MSIFNKEFSRQSMGTTPDGEKCKRQRNEIGGVKDSAVELPTRMENLNLAIAEPA